MSKRIGAKSKKPPLGKTTAPLKVKNVNYPVPAFVPSAAYVGTIPEPNLTRALDQILGTQKVVDSTRRAEVESPQSAIQPAPSVEQKMTLTYVKTSFNGKRAIYRGAAQSIPFNLGVFPNKVAPASIEIADGVFAVKVVKVKMTAEERKAFNASKPKPTLAEKAAAARKRADALQAKVDAANQM